MSPVGLEATKRCRFGVDRFVCWHVFQLFDVVGGFTGSKDEPHKHLGAQETTKLRSTKYYSKYTYYTNHPGAALDRLAPTALIPAGYPSESETSRKHHYNIFKVGGEQKMKGFHKKI